MAKHNTKNKLNVFLNTMLIGELNYSGKQELSFTYNREWLTRTNCYPISRSLNLREEPHTGSNVYAYFDNLLPDTVSIRQRLASKMNAASDSIFDLLSVLGRDCVGALQFRAENESLPILKKVSGKKISKKEIAKKLRNLSLSPLAVSKEEDFRISLAGVHEKTAFLKIKNSWYIPTGNTPTTHIFKPQIEKFSTDLFFFNSVENEWLCSEIVRELGLSVAKTQIQRFDDLNVLVVERFDRIWNKNILLRIPQEDLCQAIGVPNFNKYESEGGPGIPKIMNALYESSLPNDDRRTFMKTQIVYFLLAAIDGHAKNYSIQWGTNGFQLAPLYDILSAQPLVDKKIIQYEKLKLAMAFGDSRYYRIKDIYGRHFLQTAKLCRFDKTEMETVINETIIAVPKALDRVSKIVDQDFPTQIIESIFKGIEKRIKHF